MRSRFDEQLDLLNKEMITMGALCENAIAMSAKAVAEGDLALTESIPAPETAFTAAAGGEGSAHHLLRPENGHGYGAHRTSVC